MRSGLKENGQKEDKGTSRTLLLRVLIFAGLFGALAIVMVLNPLGGKIMAPSEAELPLIPLDKQAPQPEKPSVRAPAQVVTGTDQGVEITSLQLSDPASKGVVIGINAGENAGSSGTMPSLRDVDGIFGGESSMGNDLEVTYYDLKRNRAGRYTGIGNDEWRSVFRKFFRKDWDLTVLSPFYRASQKRYAKCVVIPATGSFMAPAAFGEDDAPGTYWLTHFQGKVVYPEDITFRFWVSADDSLAIRIDGKVVVAASFVGRNAATLPSDRATESYGSLWESDSMDSLKYVISNSRATVGDWITLKGGVPQSLEMVLTDDGGFGFTAIVAVEVKGVDYARSVWGGPLLPVFRTSEIPRDLLDIIYADLSDGELSLTNGPVFRDY